MSGGGGLWFVVYIIMALIVWTVLVRYQNPRGEQWVYAFLVAVMWPATAILTLFATIKEPWSL